MSDVFSYIKQEENAYQTMPITVIEGYEWSMYKHCKLTTLYLNSKYESGNSDEKPYKNIILDKVNLQHRAIEFDVKDIEVYVNNPDNYYKSLLTRKFHTKWARENNIGEFFDELAETFTDYGGAIVKNVNNTCPTVIPFNKIAFCDQTDIMSGAICIKHYYTPDQLKKEKGWDKEEVERVIVCSAEAPKGKETSQTKQQIHTPTNYIEVYELHGELPTCYLDEKEGSEYEFARQMHIVAFYKDDKGNRNGVTLYKGKEHKNPFKVVLRDKIAGRGLGRGAVEELFEDQVWVNYNEIQQKSLLDQASKIIYQTLDKGFTTRNKGMVNAQQGDVYVYNDGPLSQINTQPINFNLFTNKTNEWDNHAKTVSGAFDVISGENSTSGMPFRLGIMLNQEAHSLHSYRKEKLAMFVQTLYRDWILERLAEDMSVEQQFMDNLSLDEMEQIANNLAIVETNNYIKEKMWNLEIVSQEEVQAMKELSISNFKQGGTTRFFKILEGELKDLPVDVDVIITGEQKNNALVADKLSSIFSQVAQNPAILENPTLAKLFNEIIEVSGLSPLQYSSIKSYKPTTIVKPVETPPQELQTTSADGVSATQ